jgi:putative redox protein
VNFKLDHHRVIAELKYGELPITGDSDHGYGPSELLVSSVAGCSGGVLRSILDKKRMDYDDIKITADVKTNNEKANRIEQIHLHFIIKGKNLEEQKMDEAVELTKKHCPMVQSVKDSIQVEETFELTK